MMPGTLVKVPVVSAAKREVSDVGGKPAVSAAGITFAGIVVERRLVSIVT